MRTRNFAVRVLLAALICAVFCGAAFALVITSKSVQREKKAPQVQEYHQGDVKVIQGIIKNNIYDEPQRFPLNSPASWSFVAWSSIAPKRVVSLDFYAPGTDHSNDDDDVDYQPDDGLGVSGNLDLRALSELTYLSCVGAANTVREVNVSNCKKLKFLDCSLSYDLTLYNLNISGCTALEHLYLAMGSYGDEKLTFKASGCRALKHLSVWYWDSWSSYIKLADFPNLEYFNCSGTDITVLDVSKNPKLRHLECSNTQIRVLDISKNPNLEFLNCEGTQIRKLDTSRNKKLTDLIWDGKSKH